MGRWLPEVEYRDLTWAKRNAPNYRHLQLLLFWPVFGLLFWGSGAALDSREILLRFLRIGQSHPIL